ncbi:MAG: Wzz/FepE/Etk N-terminal domain-containing protein [Crocinitomicaceae bacterium]|nr:Wzz/FepE/Etk N-terminal domain-containing protein [Crocinitomicaceae bacterium]
MSENNNGLRQESQNLLIFIWQKRKIILIVSALAFVASIIVSLLMTPMFKSTAIVFPTATSTVSFSEQRNAKASSMDFGEEEQAEQLLQILQSSRIRNRIVQRFNLFEHYEIGMDDPNKNFKLGKEYNSHIQFSRTRYGSIEIDVSDRDKELAAEIANKIVQLIDTVKNEMIKERTLPAFDINKRKKQMLEDEMAEILLEMDSLSQMGVVSIEGRANLFSAYNQSKNPEDRNFFKKQIDKNLIYGARFDGLENLRDERIIKLTKFEDSYEQSESDANALFNHKFVVEDAVVADKKDKPKRMIVVFISTMGAFFFIVFALLVKERIAELRKVA